MKAKIGRGSEFRGLLDYALAGEKDAEIIGGTALGGTAREIAKELEMIRRLRPDIEKPVWHCSLSLPEGDFLSGQKWDEVANDFMVEMGFNELTPWLAIRHRDTENDHIHIIASRIDLKANVWHGKWEALIAIEVTQKLEEVHNLTLTPGLNGVDEDWQKISRVRGRKTLKKGEMELGIRTGHQPPKLKLQDLIDEVLSVGELTAVRFAETLGVSGVQVRANLTDAGIFNGFSYKLDGIAFKGSSLGKAYSWPSVQKRGVSYEQTRDFEQLAQFRAGKVEGDEGVNRSGRADIKSGTVDYAASGSVQSDELCSKTDISRVIRRIEQHNKPNSETSTHSISYKHGEPRHKAKEAISVHRVYRKSSKVYLFGSMENSRCSTNDPSCSAPIMDKKYRNSTDSIAFHYVPNSNCGLWFKPATAKRKNSNAIPLREGNTTGNRVVKEDLQPSREIDPTRFLESYGYTVKIDAENYIKVLYGADEAYRLTQKSGTWLTFDNYGNLVGDNIDLVKEITGLSGFAECVYELLGAPKAAVKTLSSVSNTIIDRQPLIMPEQSTDQGRMIGRMFLKERGISQETITHGEKTGFLRYLSDSLLFVGYQAGKEWSATKFAFDPNAKIKRKDLVGSDKSWPPILEGLSETLWIVDDGLEALAVHDVAKKQKKILPAVIVSGGSEVKGFFKNLSIVERIKAARLISIGARNKNDEGTQEYTDAMYNEQARLVREINPSAEVRIWKPEALSVSRVYELPPLL